MSYKRYSFALGVVLIVLVTRPWVTFSDATFTSSTASGVNVISAAADWTPPVVTLTVPQSPLTGTAILEATAEDPEASATTVRIDFASSGSGTWQPICAAAPSPLSCSWDTAGVADGSYDLRATATDTSGNTAEQIATNVTVDNSVP